MRRFPVRDPPSLDRRRGPKEEADDDAEARNHRLVTRRTQSGSAMSSRQSDLEALRIDFRELLRRWKAEFLNSAETIRGKLQHSAQEKHDKFSRMTMRDVHVPPQHLMALICGELVRDAPVRIQEA